MQTVSAILYLHAQTPLHPGAGHSLGIVDLPIQRERHTHWPVIPGSSVKGVLRDRFRDVNCADSSDRDDDNRVTAIFGPPPNKAGDFAGALCVTDARILAFPVRSLTGGFAWITCRAVLERYLRDLRLTGKTPGLTLAAAPGAGGARLTSLDGNSLCIKSATGQQVIFEEHALSAAADSDGALVKWAEHLAGNVFLESDEFKELRDKFKRRLVLVDDALFGHLVQTATQIEAHNRLDPQTKMTEGGALFYVECLPPETLFYALLIAEPSRNKNHGADATQTLNPMIALLKAEPVLQIGGDASTGKGLCFARLS